MRQCVGTAVLVTLGAVAMFHGNASSHGFANVQWRAIATEDLNR